MENFGNLIDEMAFILYAMECEGDLDTHQGKINRFINEMRDLGCPTDEATQTALLNECGLTEYDLSNSDIEYIRSCL